MKGEIITDRVDKLSAEITGTEADLAAIHPEGESISKHRLRYEPLAVVHHSVAVQASSVL
jgi:hypothetical protein